jgi:hypothetical protein
LVKTLNAAKPMELLQISIGSQVFDQHVNLILEDAEEISFDPETEEQTVVTIDTVIVRGDNVVIVSPPPSN